MTVTRRRLWPTMPVTTPSGSPLRFQHRPLLDVHLDIGRRRPAAGRPPPECRAGSCRRRAAPRSASRPRRRRPRARRGRTRRRRPSDDVSVGGKARAFLVAERQHVDAERQLGLGAREMLRPPECRRSRRADRRICRRRSRCRCASRSAGGGAQVAKAPAHGAERILADRQARRRASIPRPDRRRGDAPGVRNSRTSRFGSAEIAPSSEIIASARAPSASGSSAVMKNIPP